MYVEPGLGSLSSFTRTANNVHVLLLFFGDSTAYSQAMACIAPKITPLQTQINTTTLPLPTGTCSVSSHDHTGVIGVTFRRSRIHYLSLTCTLRSSPSITTMASNSLHPFVMVVRLFVIPAILPLFQHPLYPMPTRYSSLHRLFHLVI